jgi:hypothetical protein
VKPALPTLTPAIIADPEGKLALAIDRVLATSPELRELQGLLVTQQRRLRTLLSDEAWATYMEVEEATTARWAEATSVLVQWAFNEGMKSSGQQRR